MEGVNIAMIHEALDPAAKLAERFVYAGHEITANDSLIKVLNRINFPQMPISNEMYRSYDVPEQTRVWELRFPTGMNNERGSLPCSSIKRLIKLHMHDLDIMISISSSPRYRFSLLINYNGT